MFNLLDNIREPKDINNMSLKSLEELSVEIRKFLINSVSKTGGHLASNLGVVELTLSLFKNFDFTKDKIVWDVGHQSYVYKILTGRKDRFNTLRKYGGISGFPKAWESEYDFFDTGHSSTSISAALGMARARDIKGETNKVIAVIGDGALTGGMALEALNDAGYRKTDIIVIINDNGMSISKNVGGLASYLNKFRSEPGYNKLKSDINYTLRNSEFGSTIADSIGKIKDSLKQLVVPSMLFEDMGWKYLGPINGHDIKELNFILSKAKELKRPVIIHTITQKGKGYELAEGNPNKFHAIGPFNLGNGEVTIKKEVTYSKAFSDAMVDIGEKRNDLVAITAAMPDGTGLKEFSKKYPNRFFDVGIAEQHAVTLAGGIAKEGLRPVFAVYSTFLQRAYDQVLHDVCIQRLPVVFAIDRSGLVGEDGETHQGIFDISYLSHIPNLNIITPKCTSEIYPMLEFALSQNEPIAIRYPRGADGKTDFIPLESFSLGKWETLNEGKDFAIIAAGKMVDFAMQAKDILVKQGYNPTVINATFIKPIDTKLIDALIEKNTMIFTMEDNVIRGGFGETILSYISKINSSIKVTTFGFNDDFVPHGDVDILYKKYRLDPQSISEQIIYNIK
ncbi:1-deoxy-D-xylulose-5-phosphate synthase [Clostridium paridis]|uniref:1-deoxy-D-xylulose-5-phosphate synthase n=1 Tax=Clostridium paridis TaxID=2803863 RepID=A0A937FBG8_9CLOT|nr:1-deoxy-D-xylulose-5-phosphate synthase [Clostridium paridis]MBL4931010.1 1-deoxy-D-xylulose-5-phosphate synthase [Clostridium paridis]